MPGSQLAACIYTTNGAPVASPAPARAGTHAAHPVISTRRAEVAETGGEEGRGEGGRLSAGGALPGRTSTAPTSILLDDAAAEPQALKGRL